MTSETRLRAPGRARRFFAQRLGMIALAFITLTIMAAVFAPLLTPYRPEATDLLNVLQGPSAAHWLGTDDLGRDTVSRLLFGARTSLLASLLATSIAVVIGVPFGILAGFLGGGRVSYVLVRIADAFMTIPPLVLAIVIIGLLGPNLTNAMIAVGLVYAPRLFRVARSAAISVMPETYISASRTIGASTTSILMRHVLPNAIAPVLVQISLTMGTAVLAEASLSFLGLGVQPPDASWGSILGRALPFVESQPTAVISAGILISALVLSFNLVGDALRDVIGREARG